MEGNLDMMVRKVMCVMTYVGARQMVHLYLVGDVPHAMQAVAILIDDYSNHSDSARDTGLDRA